jgi:hypothetical protein
LLRRVLRDARAVAAAEKDGKPVAEPSDAAIAKGHLEMRLSVERGALSPELFDSGC